MKVWHEDKQFEGLTKGEDKQFEGLTKGEDKQVKQCSGERK